MELILRDLETEGKLSQLVVYDRDRLVDLAAAEEIPATRARKGDILFLGKSNGAATQMIITPGRSVHPKLAAGQAGEAKTINELSRRLAAETGAKAPAAAAPAAVESELDRVRRSFLFVLEFALGAPFTASQERLILDQFSPGWWAAKSAGERKSFGQYPQVVAWIMKAGQNDLEEMRRTLEETTRQWLKESPASDPVVGHDPRPAGRAGPGDRRRRAAADRDGRRRLLRALRLFPPPAPGRDGAARAACRRRRGRGAPRAAARLARIFRRRARPGGHGAGVVAGAARPGRPRRPRPARIGAPPAPCRHGSGGPRPARPARLRAGKADDAVAAMLKHNVLMNIRQQTFNTYMWSRGFNYQPATGKMW